jgi:uncharacterized membrane protein
MIFVLSVIGLFVGGGSYGFTGALLGGGIGYLLGQVVSLKARLARIEQSIEGLTATGRAVATHPAARAEARPQAEPTTSVLQPPAPEPLRHAWQEEPAAIRPGYRSASPEPTPVDDESFVFEEELGQARPRGGETILSAVRDFFAGGNLLVKIGVILLFFGVAFLLKYAVEHQRLSIEVRLAAAGLGGLALLITGWRLRFRRRGYALALQGGGLGILYLTVFAAFRLYGLLSPLPTLAVLTAMAAVSATLAVRQSSQSLAVLAVTGGFLAPLLASTGSGSHVMLFSYYLLLNVAILAIAWQQAWRLLNLVGFLFTFVIGSFWGFTFYQPAYFATTEPFLVLFYLFYVAVALLFALRQAPDLRGYIDATLVFGTPLIAFTLQGMLVADTRYGLAWSAFALGIFYFGLAAALRRRGTADLGTLTEAFLAMGAVFLTLAVPLTFDGREIASIWAVEGAGMVWVGVRQKRLAVRFFGLLLQIGAGLAFLPGALLSRGEWPILNSFYVSGLLLAAAGLFTAFLIDRYRERLRKDEGLVEFFFLAWGLFWWYGIGMEEIRRFVTIPYRNAAALLLFAGSSLFADLLGARTKWQMLRVAALLLLPAMILAAFEMAGRRSHPLAGLGALGWPVAFATHLWLLRRQEPNAETLPLHLRCLHASGLWLLTLLAIREIDWRLARFLHHAGSWRLLVWGMIPALPAALFTAGGKALPWPLRRHFPLYLGLVAGPLVLFAGVWAFYVNLTRIGDPWPLPYLPLLNVLDIGVALVHLTLFFWARRLLAGEVPARSQLAPLLHPMILAASLFVWLNAIIVRTVHYWGKIPFQFEAMFDSALLQTSLSLCWSLTALATMVFATRRGRRTVWLTGGALLAGVVVKLFAVDLSGVGTVARIVSFIGVGLLMLLIGYHSPVPPHENEER